MDPANPNVPRTLWIGDVEYWMGEDFLSEFLKRISLDQVVSNVNVITNAPKRYGFVEFTSREAAEAALKSLNDTQKPCWWFAGKFRVDWAESFNAGEGRNNPEYTPNPNHNPTPTPTPIPTPTPTPAPTPSRPDSVKKSYTIYTKPLKLYPLDLVGFRRPISEEDQLLATEEHYRILETFLGSSDLAHEAMIQPLGRYYSGFSAFIHDSVANEIKAHPNVKSVTPTPVFHLPQIPMPDKAYSAFGNSDGTCSPAMTYGPPQVARIPFECFGNNYTDVWSKSFSFSNKGEGKATSDRN